MSKGGNAIMKVAEQYADGRRYQYSETDHDVAWRESVRAFLCGMIWAFENVDNFDLTGFSEEVSEKLRGGH